MTVISYADKDWVNKKIDGHGACYSHKGYNGLVTIIDIYGKSKLVIFYYNTILYLKYLKRKIKQYTYI